MDYNNKPTKITKEMEAKIAALFAIKLRDRPQGYDNIWFDDIPGIRQHFGFGPVSDTNGLWDGGPDGFFCSGTCPCRNYCGRKSPWQLATCIPEEFRDTMSLIKEL